MQSNTIGVRIGLEGFWIVFLEDALDKSTKKHTRQNMVVNPHLHKNDKQPGNNYSYHGFVEQHAALTPC